MPGPDDRLTCQKLGDCSWERCDRCHNGCTWDRCDRCQTPRQALWLGWSDLDRLGFEAVCDQCWEELRESDAIPANFA